MLRRKRVWVIADTVEEAGRIERIFSASDAFAVNSSLLSRGAQEFSADAADVIVIYSHDPTVARSFSVKHPQISLLELHPPTRSTRPLGAAHALLPDTASPAQIRAAAMALAEGLTITVAPESSASGSEPEFDLLEPLTERELEVLNLVADGLSNPAIASQLGVSRNTVKFHVSSIIQKLGARSRTEAVILGLKRGLIIV